MQKYVDIYLLHTVASSWIFINIYLFVLVTKILWWSNKLTDGEMIVLRG